MVEEALSSSRTWPGLPHHGSPLAIRYATLTPLLQLVETRKGSLHPSLEGRGQVAAAGDEHEYEGG